MQQVNTIMLSWYRGEEAPLGPSLHVGSGAASHQLALPSELRLEVLRRRTLPRDLVLQERRLRADSAKAGTRREQQDRERMRRFVLVDELRRSITMHQVLEACNWKPDAHRQDARDELIGSLPLFMEVFSVMVQRNHLLRQPQLNLQVTNKLAYCLETAQQMIAGAAAEYESRLFGGQESISLSLCHGRVGTYADDRRRQWNRQDLNNSRLLQPPSWSKDCQHTTVLNNSLSTTEGLFTACRVRLVSLLQARLDPTICYTPVRRELGDTLVFSSYRAYLCLHRAMHEKAQSWDYWASSCRRVDRLVSLWFLADPALSQDFHASENETGDDV